MTCKDCKKYREAFDAITDLANIGLKEIKESESEVERLSKEFNEAVKQLRKGL